MKKFYLQYDEVLAERLSLSSAEFLVKKLKEEKGVDVHLYIAFAAKKTIESYCQYCKEVMPWHESVAQKLCDGLATATLNSLREDNDYSPQHVFATLTACMSLSIDKYRVYVTS